MAADKGLAGQSNFDASHLWPNSAEPAPYTQAQFKAYVAKEIKDWARVVHAAGLKVE